jgi:hypothetical protein
VERHTGERQSSRNLENIDGIRTVEQNDQINDRLSSPRSKPRSLDDEEYIVLAKAGTNTLETEVLLKTNIKEGTSLYLIQLGDKVLGWGGAVLDAKAKEVVEATTSSSTPTTLSLSMIDHQPQNSNGNTSVV